MTPDDSVRGSVCAGRLAAAPFLAQRVVCNNVAPSNRILLFPVCAIKVLIRDLAGLRGTTGMPIRTGANHVLGSGDRIGLCGDLNPRSALRMGVSRECPNPDHETRFARRSPTFRPAALPRRCRLLRHLSRAPRKSPEIHGKTEVHRMVEDLGDPDQNFDPGHCGT